MPYRPIHPDRTADDASAASFVSVRTTSNLRSLAADRGVGAPWTYGYDLSSLMPASAPFDALCSHPDFWFSLPLIVRPSPGCDTLSVAVLSQITAPGVELALWLEGRVGPVVTATGHDVVTARVYPPSRGEMRAALLIRSLVGNIDFTLAPATLNPDSSILATGIGVGTNVPASRLVVVDAPEGTRSRYLAHHSRDADSLVVWPDIERALFSVFDVETFEIGLIRLSSVSGFWSQSSGPIAGLELPRIADVLTGQNIRYLDSDRMVVTARDIYQTRSHVLSSGGAAVAGLKSWGASTGSLRPDVANVAYRVRKDSTGVIVSLLYACPWNASLQVIIGADGAAGSDTLTLQAGTENESRSTPNAPVGTLPPMMRGYGRASSIGSICYHSSAEAAAGALDGDVSRLRYASIIVPYTSPVPAIGAILTVHVYGDVRQVIVMACTVTEYLLPVDDQDFLRLPDPIGIGAPIASPTWDTVRQNVAMIYARSLRCHWSVAGSSNGGTALQPFFTGASTGVLGACRIVTSGDLPTTEIRVAARAESITLTIELYNEDGTSLLDSDAMVYTTLADQSVTLTVASNTRYLLEISTNGTGSPAVYWLLVDEVRL